MAFIPEKILLG